MLSNKIIRISVLIFFLTISSTLIAQFEPRICTFDQEVCSVNEKFFFYYVGNNCNCCNPVGSEAALVDKYHIWGVCGLGYYFTTYDYSYYIPSSTAATAFEQWGNYCEDCI